MLRLRCYERILIDEVMPTCFTCPVLLRHSVCWRILCSLMLVVVHHCWRTWHWSRAPKNQMHGEQRSVCYNPLKARKYVHGCVYICTAFCLVSRMKSCRQGCGLGLDVSVSRRSRYVPTSRLGLGLGHLRLVPKTMH